MQLRRYTRINERFQMCKQMTAACLIFRKYIFGSIFFEANNIFSNARSNFRNKKGNFVPVF